MGRTRLRSGPSFETPRKDAAPQDDGGVCGSEKIVAAYLLRSRGLQSLARASIRIEAPCGISERR
jgi:hypothetical protein